MTAASAPESGYRFERKYRIDGAHPAEIEDWVRRSGTSFRRAWPCRLVNNIYLDTAQFRHYFENMAGVAGRTKIRVRWYGELLGRIASPRLEFKIKSGMLGTKRIFPLVPFRLEPGFARRDVERIFEGSALEAAVRRDLKLVEPTLINRYRRKYLVSANGTYRITIDTGLEFLRIGPLGNSLIGRRSLEGSTVMEIKYDGAIADLDHGLINLFPFRVTRMSKYVTGIELTQLW